MKGFTRVSSNCEFVISVCPEHVSFQAGSNMSVAMSREH